MLFAALLLAPLGTFLAGIAPQDPPAPSPQAAAEFLAALTRAERLGEPPARPGRIHVARGATRAGDELLAEIAGHGSLTRIWLPEPHGSLSFFVGGAAEPVLVLDLADPAAAAPAFGDALVERPAGAFDSRVPLPFRDGLRVVASAAGLRYRLEFHLRDDSDLPAAPDAAFWQDHAESLRLAGRLLREGQYLVQPRKRTTSTALLPTNQPMLSRIDGEGVVLGFQIDLLNLDEIDPALVLRGLRMQVRTDGTELIDLPLADFFALGCDAAPPAQSHLLRAWTDVNTGMHLSSALPMPFSGKFMLTLANESLQRPQVRITTYFALGDAGPWRLHAAWRRLREVEAPDGVVTLRLADADGPGRLLGVAVNLRAPEGVDAAIDESGFFGLPPGPLAPRRGAFSGTSAGDGWVSFDRLLVESAWLFDDRIVLDLPLRLGEGSHELAVTAWWYAPAAAGHAFGPLPDPLERALK